MMDTDGHVKDNDDSNWFVRRSIQPQRLNGGCDGSLKEEGKSIKTVVQGKGETSNRHVVHSLLAMMAQKLSSVRTRTPVVSEKKLHLWGY